ncbi:MAG TPA: beta-N-acetylhexosaminidase [Terriglobales bacterium]
MAPKFNLDLRQQVGQLLLMGFEGVECSARLRSTFASLQPGGIILFKRNITGAEQTWKLLREAQVCIQQPAFLCVDVEGGTVDRLKDVIAPAPAAAEVFATGNRKLFRKHGRILGDECRALGFNVDFNPVVDIGFEPSRPVLTSRTVSDDPEDVVTFAREVLRGMSEAGVIGCGKHFPGLGEANLDTHKELPSISKPAKKLWNEDLFPYRKLHKQMPIIMVAHAAYPSVTRDNAPASLSKKWMVDILRKKIGFRGVVMADDLEMGGVLATASIEDAAVETLKAGSDLFPICHNAEKAWSCYEAVLSAAERDRRFAAQIAQKAARVMALKKKAGLAGRRTPPPSQKTLDRLRRALWELTEEVRLEKTAPV